MNSPRTHLHNRKITHSSFLLIGFLLLLFATLSFVALVFKFDLLNPFKHFFYMGFGFCLGVILAPSLKIWALSESDLQSQNSDISPPHTTTIQPQQLAELKKIKEDLLQTKTPPTPPQE